MSIQRDRLWRFHKYKGDTDFCPLCGDALKWVYDREKEMWSPCNREPVMYITGVPGVVVEVYSATHRVTKGILYNSWDKRFTRKNTKFGHLPHVYTCEILRERK